MTKIEFIETIADVLEIPLEKLNENSSLSKDFGLDSLDILRLISSIENKYDVEIDETQIDLLDDIEKAYIYIKSLISLKK